MNTEFAMLNTPEIILILIFALVFFGAKKLPEMARGLGQGVREFRKAAQEASEEITREVASSPPPPPAAPPVETRPATTADAARKS